MTAKPSTSNTRHSLCLQRVKTQGRIGEMKVKIKQEIENQKRLAEVSKLDSQHQIRVTGYKIKQTRSFSNI